MASLPRCSAFALVVMLFSITLSGGTSTVVVMDDGLSTAQVSGHRDLGEGDEPLEELEGEVDTASSLVHLKGMLDRLQEKGLTPEVPQGDLGESVSIGDDTLDALLAQTCASTASDGYYDSSSCKPDAAVLKKMISHLKQRETQNKPLTFKEYGKLETFYAIQSMAELSKIHALKTKKRLNKQTSHELYEQETKVLNALHAETEVANHVQRKSRSAQQQTMKQQAVKNAAQQEIEVAKQRLARAQANEVAAKQAIEEQHEDDNALLYKTWTDKGVLQAEQKAEKEGKPEKYSTVQDEEMKLSKMVAPMMHSVMPNVVVGVKMKA